MWKLVPPKPNALTPAQRARPLTVSQGRVVVLTRTGEAAQSMLGLGYSKPRPAAPAAGLRCPMLDLTEPRAIDPAGRPAPVNAPVRLAISTASPTGVEVPCASTIEQVAGDSPES